MTLPTGDDRDRIFPVCRALLGARLWDELLRALGDSREPAQFADALPAVADDLALPPFLADLARIEWAKHVAQSSEVTWPSDPDDFEINPTLELVQTPWNLAPLFASGGEERIAGPAAEPQWVIVWRPAPQEDVRVESASDEELLALKMVAEGLDAEHVAAAGPLTIGAVDAVLARAAGRGLLIAPRSRLRRDTSAFPDGEATPDEVVTAYSFSLQWHITQRCDLHCKHCYDRSERSPLTLEQGLRILDDLRAFCRERRVRGYVCFTGGNPLMHPHFFDLYQAAADRGFPTSVLGNPAPRRQVERILDIQKPGYYQVSLEGLRERNDEVRGAGHFDRTVAFLAVLRELGVWSTVMLTLSRDNIGDVLPLADFLRDKAGRFTFNRLSPVGEGANMQLPTREEYAAFLEAYVEASRSNPIISFKDNMLNVVLRRRGEAPFDGCTGFGCGAAFNFLAVLPDGEAHACRKFPSLIGNVLEQSIGEIYDSEAAERYRRGSAACAGCTLRAYCGGCLAIASGLGLDAFVQRDPFCLMHPAESPSSA